MSEPKQVKPKKERKPKQPKVVDTPAPQIVPNTPAPEPAQKKEPKQKKPRAPKKNATGMTQAERQILGHVQRFIEEYAQLAENDEDGHERNETRFLDSILDIFAPSSETEQLSGSTLSSANPAPSSQ